MATSRDGDTVTFEFDLPADYAGFAGHFPGEPVLPGMCHVALAVEVVRRAHAPDAALRRVMRARFTRKVAPGERLRIVLRPDSGGARGDGALPSAAERTWRASHSVGGERAAEIVFVST